MKLQTLHKRTLLHTALFIIAVTCSLFANAQGHVVFKGSILVVGGTNDEVSMIVTDGVDTMDVMIGRQGQYNFAVPTNEKVQVILTSANYITKVIELDTHNAPEAKGAFARAEQVEFYVQLELRSINSPMAYSGPVGMIYFTPQGEGVLTMLTPTTQAQIELANSTITAEL